ncbi:hypothetical protein WISP_36714 [Willisornis vidua]|uniref:Vitamin K-dependent protein S n=1 Tax=Willisornis vidua TaxID=1566151 RepID=A0ABQ9DPC2_9PASS|nr:hypothetical protein WISP_36714 [Willisornis vidua]
MGPRWVPLLAVAIALAEAATFLSQQYASQFLLRKRRANSFMEESKKGNLERECIEELCNKEEAREVFENNPETEYFYPKYLEISNQCSPLPCHKDGYKECIDGKGKYTCVCKPGWRGENCEEDINECVLHPNICGTATCKNTQGKYECECPEGYTYNSTSKNCEDIDECAENVCAQLCVNSPGSYSCYCDGKKGFKLSKDMKNCESITDCIPLNLEKNYELLYLAEQFIGIPVLYLKFKLPNVTRFTAEFDFRTYDAEGVILYAESSDTSAWILLALRDGKIEIQFKNEFGTKVTSGGKAINDGLWHIKITVTIGRTTVAHLESKKLCTPRKVQVGLVVTKQDLELSVDSHTDRRNPELLSILNQAMMANVVTYLGGLPDVPLGATPVTAFYNGCMEVKVNHRQLDLDEAISKHNDIRSHSCPLIMQ